MDDYQKFLDPRTLARLKGLELRARTIVEGYVAGVHKSPYHGFSIEFAEHREYAPGDDLRYVDWKVFGKTDKFYLKQYEQETNLISYLALDTSESVDPQSQIRYEVFINGTLHEITVGTTRTTAYGDVGTNTIEVFAIDNAGNRSSAGTITLVIAL